MAKSLLSTTKVFLGIVLVVGILAQLSIYDYPYAWDDVNRDVLIARHIIDYREYPLAGYSSAVGGFKNSPFSFYLTAFLLSLKNDPYFLGLVNIILRATTALTIFLLAKKMFGRKEGLLASALFTLNPISFYQTIHLWQPWLMQIFVNLSYLFLFTSYKKNKFSYLILGVFFLITSVVFHNSAIAIAPIFIILTFFTLKKQKAKIAHYAGYGLSFLLFLLIYYLPILFYYFNNQSGSAERLSDINILGIWEIFSKFLFNIFYFINTSLFYPEKNFLFMYALPIIALGAIFNYLARTDKEKNYAIIMIFAIIASILSTSIFNVGSFTTNYFYYFTPVFGLFLILLARSVVFVFGKKKSINMLLTAAGLIYFGFFLTQYVNLYSRSKNRSSVNPAAEAIKNEAISIKKAEGYQDFSFFQIASRVESHGWKYSASLWMPLENDLATKFTRVSDRDIRSFEEINKDADYVFLVCPRATPENTEQCTSAFLNEKGKYSLQRQIFSNARLAIFILHKQS